MPAGGSCAAPIAIAPGGGTLTGITSGASALSGSCAASASLNAPEQVFQWTPATSGTATIQTCGAGTAFDTVVYVLNGTCGGAEIACNDDTTGCGTSGPCTNASHHGSKLTPTVTAGQSYIIVVDGYNGSCGGSLGSFSLSVTPPP